MQGDKAKNQNAGPRGHDSALNAIEICSQDDSLGLVPFLLFLLLDQPYMFLGKSGITENLSVPELWVF